MIAHLRGEILSRGADSLVVDVHGVGYEVMVSAHLAAGVGEIGTTISLVICTDVRENAIVLYGFQSAAERNAFTMLRQVKGIGSRIALSVLSTLDPPALMRAIGLSDASMLQRVPGIGKKSAERIIVELREQVLQLGNDTERASSLHARVEVVPSQAYAHAGAAGDAVLAMEQLGFSSSDAERAVESAVKEQGTACSTADILKGALKFIGIGS